MEIVKLWVSMGLIEIMREDRSCVDGVGSFCRSLIRL